MVDEVEEKVEVAHEPEEVQHKLVVEEEPKIEEVCVWHPITNVFFWTASRVHMSKVDILIETGDGVL